jgi:hypothetical protein
MSVVDSRATVWVTSGSVVVVEIVLTMVTSGAVVVVSTARVTVTDAAVAVTEETE